MAKTECLTRSSSFAALFCFPVFRFQSRLVRICCPSKIKFGNYLEPAKLFGISKAKRFFAKWIVPAVDGIFAAFY